MIDAFMNWIGKGELSGCTADELAMHLRHTDYFMVGIGICLALLWVQYKEVIKQDYK
ncbi:hypothetical protein [Spirosoma endophyticum]|uniref:Uncharacterized protein n=1 Tax=Spirosoma endophyticum TaxID=662367 RepID=A0A1I2D5T5_9BACT|nr:hypothetical protein [Spirosoma endophyticum]SFE75851.1 hypothetical protein SAMN05216167_11917 [Spirosoma endophyticum]